MQHYWWIPALCNCSPMNDVVGPPKCWRQIEDTGFIINLGLIVGIQPIQDYDLNGYSPQVRWQKCVAATNSIVLGSVVVLWSVFWLDCCSSKLNASISFSIGIVHVPLVVVVWGAWSLRSAGFGLRNDRAASACKAYLYVRLMIIIWIGFMLSLFDGQYQCCVSNIYLIYSLSLCDMAVASVASGVGLMSRDNWLTPI